MTATTPLPSATKLPALELDFERYDWQPMTDPTETGYRIDYSLAMLGYDVEAGTCETMELPGGRTGSLEPLDRDLPKS